MMCHATARQRLISGVVFVGVAAVFGWLYLAATDRLDAGRWFGPCGFKQQWGLPCPACGMTTSALHFVRGSVIESFYVQPAAGLICVCLVLVGFFAFLAAVFGLYFSFVKRFLAWIKTRYVILALVVIGAGGWAVTLARAVAEQQSRN